MDPTEAQKGDLLPGGFTVLKRLGQGACSIALLVERDGQEYVLKAASDTDQNARIQEEAEVLKKLRHQHIVEFCEPVEIGDHAAFLMHPVLVDKSENASRRSASGCARKGGCRSISSSGSAWTCSTS